LEYADTEVGIGGKRVAKDAVGAKGEGPPGNVVKVLIAKFDRLANLVHDILPESGDETIDELRQALLAFREVYNTT
jgi:hypothetical protein